MSHHDVEDMLGAYALDAVDGDEVEPIEDHLSVCPKCRAELAGYREVASVFAFSGQEAPAGIWDRITTSMQEIPPPLRLDRLRGHGSDLVVHPLPSPVEGAAGADPPTKPRADAAARQRWRMDRGRARVLFAVAAAVAIIGLAVQVVHLHDRVNTMQQAVTAPATALDNTATMADVKAALRAPGRRAVTLTALTGTRADLHAVVEPDGTGYLYDSKLTPLPSDRTYQLWGVHGAARVSYGLLGTSPGVEEFEAGSGVDSLAVTDEVSSGVVVSSQVPVAAGVVSPHL